MKTSARLREVIVPAEIAQHDGSGSALRSVNTAATLSVSALLRALVRIEEKIDRVQKDMDALRNGSDDSEFVTVAEAASILRRSPYTIRRWLREGKLEGSKTTNGNRGQYLIRREELDSLLQDGRYYG